MRGALICPGEESKETLSALKKTSDLLTQENPMAKILIIEDTENNRVLLSRRLKPKGHDIVTADDAESGLPLIEAEKPELILMDVGLPGMDGWNATRALKQNPATRHIPVIALTAHAMQGDREKAVEAGCDDYETKPIDFNRLFEKIERLVGVRH
jgi:two-component system, cell cycle response regulator DivK